ncbi:MAG: hypothetical protein WCL39_02735, partial [Armatimonadota bacterium]
LLYSGATHRSGAVANTDIATALTNWLGEPIVIGSGSKLEDRPEDDPVGRLHLLEAQARYQSQSQAIVYVLVYASFAAIALAGFSVFAGKRRGYLALACLPPTFFAALLAVTPLYLSPAVLGVACVAAGLAVAMVCATWSRFRCEYLAVVAVAVGLAAFVFQWYQSAAASYQIAGGARYFGIGNEYSGFFQGAFLCLAASPLLGLARWGRWLGLVCVLVLAGAVGHPSVGANAGDMLGGLIGFIAVGIVLLGKRGKRWALPGLAVALLLLAALGALDASRPAESQSHIGRAVGEIASGGTSAAAAIVLRKLELNMMLVRNSPWSLLLAAECTGTISLLIAMKRKGAKTDIAQIQGLVALVVALFILNDSGTLSGAAAGMWMFLAVSQQYSFANNAIHAK